jgi:hypothetical protein
VNKGRGVRAQCHGHTNGVDIVMLEQRAHHGVYNHGRWDLQCFEFQRSQSKNKLHYECEATMCAICAAYLEP